MKNVDEKTAVKVVQDLLERGLISHSYVEAMKRKHPSEVIQFCAEAIHDMFCNDKDCRYEVEIYEDDGIPLWNKEHHMEWLEFTLDIKDSNGLSEEGLKASVLHFLDIVKVYNEQPLGGQAIFDKWIREKSLVRSVQ